MARNVSEIAGSYRHQTSRTGGIVCGVGQLSVVVAARVVAIVLVRIGLAAVIGRRGTIWR